MREMRLTIRTRRRAVVAGTPAGFPRRAGAVPQRANDSVVDEAASHLRQALAFLDLTDNLIAAAYVDQALSMLRVQRPGRAIEA